MVLSERCMRHFHWCQIGFGSVRPTVPRVQYRESHFCFFSLFVRLLQTASPFPASGKKERKEICNSKIRQNTRRLTKSCIRSIMIAVFNIKQVDILYCCLIKEVATKPKQNYFIQRKASKLPFLHSTNFSFTLLLCAYEY